MEKNSKKMVTIKLRDYDVGYDKKERKREKHYGTVDDVVLE